MKLIGIAFIVFVSCLLVSSGCNKSSDNPVSPTTGSIQGTITDGTTGIGISGATITTQPVTSSATTSAQGVYTISGVNTGQYTVLASKSGYTTNSVQVAVIAGQTATASITMTAVPVNNDLIAYYPFNGNANDASGNNHDMSSGTMNNVSLTTDRLGNTNAAYLFTPSSTMYVPVGSEMNVTAVTLMAWVKCTGATNYDSQIISVSDSTGNLYDHFSLTVLEGSFPRRFYFSSSNLTSTSNMQSQTRIDTTWHNVAVTFDNSTHLIKYYIDGRLDITYTNSGTLFPITGRTFLCIGGDRRFGNYYQGSIDEVRIFNRALTDTEVQSIADVPETNDLVAYYPFNGNANDASGNNNNGTVYGATLTSDRHGNSSSAYSFSGGDSIIITSPNIPIGNANRTVACWIKTSQSSVSTRILAWGDATTFGGLFCFLNREGGNFNFWGHYADVNPTAFIGDNQWHYLVTTYDGSQIKLYLDDSLLVSQSVTLNTTDTRLSIGRGFAGDPGTPFDGIIDEVRIYNRALSTIEIGTLYNQ